MTAATRKARTPKLTYSTDEATALKAIIKTGTFALDLETRGLDPHASDADVGVYIVGSDKKLWMFRQMPEWMPLVMEDGDTRVDIFNVSFDLQWFMKKGVTKFKNVRDLYMDELLVSDQRRGVRHDLGSTIQKRLGVKIEKGIDHDVTNWLGDLSPEMEKYALEDVAYMPALADELDRLVGKTRQEKAAVIERDASVATAWMKYNGIPIDRLRWQFAGLEWAEHMADYQRELTDLWPEVNNWDSSIQIRRAAKTHLGISILSTRKDVLHELAPHWSEFGLLAWYRLYQKRVSSWYFPKKPRKGERVRTSFLSRYVNPVTCRIHPAWWQIGTNTCRYSCSSPNFQQIPRDKKLRALIKARKGYKIIKLDYSQIEVLVEAVYIAQMTGDTSLLQVFYDHGDFHTANVARILNKDPSLVTPNERQMGKAVTFHSLFGGGPRGLVDYAKNFDVVMTLEEATTVQARLFRAYPGLLAVRTDAYRRFDRHPGLVEVRNLIGMRRLLVGDTCKPTTYLNTIVQSTAGNGIKRGMKRCLDVGLGPYMIQQIHDELVFEAPDEIAEEVGNKAIAAMTRGMRDVLGNVPVTVEPTKPMLKETWS